MTFKHLVVSGATGWLGGELIIEVLKHNDFQYSNIVAISSTDGTFRLNNRMINHISFENLKNIYLKENNMTLLS